MFNSDYNPVMFSYLASAKAEELIEKENIDIIESQDYEAPLFFFQLRRAMKFGPQKKPPCLIHLHSPTEFLVKYNNDNIYDPYFFTAKRLEEFSICNADKLISPSSFLKDEVLRRYKLKDKNIKVIPYPIDEIPFMNRSNETWENGSICYIGRLERRKGILEWIKAAVIIALKNPSLTFEFLGSFALDNRHQTSNEIINLLIPNKIKKQFKFHGEVSKSLLPELLSRSKIAVIPSRWDNYPYACIEAMATGLPVLSTSNGGMVEVIKDKVNGWISDGSILGLKKSIEIAIKTPPDILEKMGIEASKTINRTCNNNKILNYHLGFKNKCVLKGAINSIYMPGYLSQNPKKINQIKQNANKFNDKISIIIISNCDYITEKAIKNIEHQVQSIGRIIVVRPEESNLNENNNSNLLNNLSVVFKGTLASGLNDFISYEQPSEYLLVLNGGIELGADFISTSKKILKGCEQIGIVSSWTKHIKDYKYFIPPLPSFPYHWVLKELAPVGVIKSQCLYSLKDKEYIRDIENIWDFFTLIMVNGWIAVNIPDIKAEIKSNMFNDQYISKKIYKKYSSLLVNDVDELIKYMSYQVDYLRNYKELGLPIPLYKVKKYMKDPKSALKYLYLKYKSKLNKYLV